MINELMYFIETETGFSLDTYLFKNYFPSDLENSGVVVSNSVGGSIDFYLPGKEEWLISVTTRSRSMNTCYADARLMKLKLHRRQDQLLPIVDSGGQFKIMTSWCASSPKYIGMDEKKRHRYTFDVVLNIKEM